MVTTPNSDRMTRIIIFLMLKIFRPFGAMCPQVSCFKLDIYIPRTQDITNTYNLANLLAKTP